MSAILARLNFVAAPIDEAEFDRAAAAQAHYGSGGSRWCAGEVALWRADGAPRWEGARVLVCDARIDDRDTLGRRLGLPPGRAAGLTAAELILAAYERWGERCPQYLLGDYAFALWDGSTRHLFCARDHIGARPLYYHASANALVVASDIRAIEAFAGVDRTLDPEAVARYLCWLVPSGRSFLRSTQALPPGHTLLAGDGRVRLGSYWSPGQGPDVRLRDSREYAQALRGLLESAVDDRVQFDAPVGSHLSGGLDSTGVTVLAQRMLRQRGRGLTRAYAWTPEVSDRYPWVDGDERRLIDAVCRCEGLQWNGPQATAEDFRDSLARDLAVEGGTDLFEERAVMVHAASLGIRTMLSGWGGDEAATFPGNGYPAWLLTHGHWARLWALLQQETGGMRHPRRWLDYVWHAAVVPLLPDAAYAKTRLSGPVAPGLGLLGTALSAQFPHVAGERHPLWREVGDPRERQIALIAEGHLARRMETWAHWAAEHGLVYAYPLTDRRVLDFVLGLPPEMLYQQGHWRYLFRSALADTLPGEIAWRRDKWDPVNERKRQDLRAGCRALLAQDVAAGKFAGHAAGWIDVQRLVASLQAASSPVVTRDVAAFAAARVAVRVLHAVRVRPIP